jgi:AcrR family transcriptional regulator
MVHELDDEESALLYSQIVALERDGLVTRTFRRLDPDRQLAVIEAILEEAAARGPTSLAIKRVAARAHVAVGSLYQYFPDRDGMLVFAATVSSRFLTACFEQYRPMLAALPLRDALAAYLGGGVEWSRMYAGFVRFFARAAYQGDVGFEDQVVEPVATAMRETVRDMLAAAHARGELREDVDIEWAARLTHALTIAVGDGQLLPHLNAYFQVLPEGVPGEAATAAAIDFVVAAIGVEGRNGS